MYSSPPPDVRYLCRCGQVCAVERVHSWTYVTCTNPKCREQGKRLMPTWGIHTIHQEDLKHV